MTLVVDASVAVKWVVAEEGRAEALQRAAGEELIAPDFVVTESANILWKKVRLGQLDHQQAQEGLSFISGAFTRLFPTRQLISRALTLAVELDHPVYDCIYLACSEVEGSEFLTADRRLANKAAGRPGLQVTMLGGLAS